MFAMSAKLLHTLLLFLVVRSFAATADDDDPGGGRVSATRGSKQGNESIRQAKQKTHHLLIEEVDKTGRGVVKELELPDYDDSEEQRRDEKRRQEQRHELDNSEARRYGCHHAESEQRRRKCLQMWKKWLQKSYRSWRETMSRIIKEVDAKIKNLGNEIGRKPRNADLKFTSAFSPGDGKE